MSKRSKEAAFKAYPFIDGEMSKTQNANAGRMYARNIFKKGYEQAEKDLELTWEDLATIEKIGDDLVKHNQTPMSDEEFYKEVLQRFKESKKNKP